MRPVLLEMEGFASFREKTTVRFDDVDYFALVGPTGAGKSTIIDALTFALYGTVARWDKENMVSPALAPTANRGVVRLIFDVSGARYSAVRELRRSGGKNPTVGVKNARLERYPDTTATGDEEDVTETLASDSEVTAAVEGLLGLSFKQFCTCVALPQGDFAEFLHVKAGDRQKILIKLLGLEMYERIARAAGAEASLQLARAETLAGQLGLYADATEDATAELTKRVKQLAKLQTYVEKALPKLDKLTEENTKATGRVDLLTDELAQLTAVHSPAGVADLELARTAAEATLATATTEVTKAEASTRTARADLTAAPARSVLEQTRRHWSELAAATTATPHLAKAKEQAEHTAAQATADRDASSQALPGLRDERDELTRRSREARLRETTVQDELALLTAIHEPAGIADLSQRHATAATAAATATAEIERAEASLAVARSALEAAVDAGTLATTADRGRSLVQLLSDDQAERATRAETATRLAKVAEHHDQTRIALEAAEVSIREAEKANAARTLQSTLVVGHACPVCLQQVHDLPHPDSAGDLDAARARLAEATTAHKAATKALGTAQRSADRAADAHVESIQRAENLRTALLADLSTLGLAEGAKALGVPLASGASDKAVQRLLDATKSLASRLDEAAGERDQLVLAARDAEATLANARAAAKTARAELERLEADVKAARIALRSAREKVLALGAPTIGDDDLRAGWLQLTTWANENQKDRAAELPGLAEAAQAAEQAAEAATTVVTTAEQKALLLQDETTAAAVAAQSATTELEANQQRIAELKHALAGSLSDDEAAITLEHVATLEADVERAEQALDEAQRERDAAAVQHEQVSGQVSDSRRRLARTRDPLAQLGAPTPEGPDILAAWTELLDWAAHSATARQHELQAARALAESTRDSVRELETQIQDHVAADAVSLAAGKVDRPLRDVVPVAVASALTQAQEQERAMRKRLEESADLRTSIDQAAEASQVAKKLADLMRADQFPRWLVASALDVLVTEASAVLNELSGGQFELSHSDGDFVIIDHNEADAVRPVKTLSGGETFQASLALALALSSKMSSLAAAGAAQLDSIFLDEGFGTLDESTLDTVAGTLENLAMSGSRMVGLVTHVRALADRVPVRFQVRRDASGSHITREAL